MRGWAHRLRALGHSGCRWRRLGASWPLALALLALPNTASAEVNDDGGEAPAVFVDLSSSMRIYPNANAALIGFATGALWRPTAKCVHLAGEAYARFGSRPGPNDNLKMRTAGGAVGGMWGSGNSDRWFGAGSMFDLGWARVGSRNDFVLTGYLRGLLYWRLRKEFWVGLDARAGHVIVPVTVEGIGIKGPLLGLGIGAVWGGAPYGAP